MENAIVSLVCISLILMGSLSIASGSISSVAMLSEGWKQMTAHTIELSRTSVEAVSAELTDTGSHAELTVKNDGERSLADFPRWDIIVTYQDGTAHWLPYTTASPGWNVDAILWNGNPETFNHNILDKQEEMRLSLRLFRPVAQGTANLAIVCTPNGARTQAGLSW